MYRRVQRRHQERGGSSLARNVAKRDYHATVGALYEVVVVAANFVTGKADALQLVAGDVGRLCGLKALLNLARQL